jgi:hypothetical protein
MKKMVYISLYITTTCFQWVKKKLCYIHFYIVQAFQVCVCELPASLYYSNHPKGSPLAPQLCSRFFCNSFALRYSSTLRLDLLRRLRRMNKLLILWKSLYIWTRLLTYPRGGLWPWMRLIVILQKIPRQTTLFLAELFSSRHISRSTHTWNGLAKQEREMFAKMNPGMFITWYFRHPYTLYLKAL